MFSSGEAKGKGKSRAPRKEGGQGHLLPKTRLSVEKFTGVVTAWRGKYGWIKPDEEIEHEKASMHNGDLFVGLDDLEGGITALEDGAPVEFHITEDESGLGAEEVVMTGPGDPEKKVKGKGGKGAAKGAGKAFGAGKVFAPWVPVADGFGGKAAGKAWVPVPAGFGGKAGGKAWAGLGKFGGAPGMVIRPMGGKAADKGSAWGKGGGKTKSGNPRGQGHTLPRTRVSVEKFTGTCTSWKGKYGWITPTDEIDHEKASKNGGSLWVSMNDIEGAESLEPDCTVEFHIWEDASGLGAEEVVVL